MCEEKKNDNQEDKPTDKKKVVSNNQPSQTWGNVVPSQTLDL